MEKRKYTSTFLKLFLYLAALCAFHYVDAQEIISSVQDAKTCLSDGGVTCQTRTNNSESICCEATEFGASNCTSRNLENYFNFEFCSTDVFDHPQMIPFTYPFDINHCASVSCVDFPPFKSAAFLYASLQKLRLSTYCSFIFPAVVDACVEEYCTSERAVRPAWMIEDWRETTITTDECTTECNNAQDILYDDTTDTYALHPYLQKCYGACGTNDQQIKLDPLFNNETVISGIFDRNNPSTCSFQAYAIPDLIELGSNYYDYQIEINITEMQGVSFDILNGTTVYAVDDYASTNLPRNFSYNATWDTHTDQNNLFFTFTPNFDEHEQAVFVATIGLVPKEIWTEAEDEELAKLLPIQQVPIIYKYITFNEKVVMFTLLLGLFAWCVYKKYSGQIQAALTSLFKKGKQLSAFDRWQQKKKVIELIAEANMPRDPWAGNDDEDLSATANILNFTAGNKLKNKVVSMASVADYMAMLDGQNSSERFDFAPSSKRKLMLGDTGNLEIADSYATHNKDDDNDQMIKKILTADEKKYEDPGIKSEATRRKDSFALRSNSEQWSMNTPAIAEYQTNLRQIAEGAEEKDGDDLDDSNGRLLDEQIQSDRRMKTTQVETLCEQDLENLKSAEKAGGQLQDQQIRMIQKLAELQHEDDMSAMQIDDIQASNSKLEKMIADKQQLRVIEQQVREEENLSAIASSKRSEQNSRNDSRRNITPRSQDQQAEEMPVKKAKKPKAAKNDKVGHFKKLESYYEDEAQQTRFGMSEKTPTENEVSEPSALSQIESAKISDLSKPALKTMAGNQMIEEEKDEHKDNSDDDEW